MECTRKRKKDKYLSLIKLNYPLVYKSLGADQVQLIDLNNLFCTLGLRLEDDIESSCESLLRYLLRVEKTRDGGVLCQDKSIDTTNHLDSLPDELLCQIFEYILSGVEYPFQIISYLLIDKRLSGITRYVFTRERRRLVSSIHGLGIFRLEPPAIRNNLSQIIPHQGMQLVDRYFGWSYNNRLVVFVPDLPVNQNRQDMFSSPDCGLNILRDLCKSMYFSIRYEWTRQGLLARSKFGYMAIFLSKSGI